MKLGVPEERVAVIPNGVDAVKYSPGPSGLKSQLKADRIFVYQGRIAPEKNVESLLKAWKQCNFWPGERIGDRRRRAPSRFAATVLRRR